MEAFDESGIKTRGTDRPLDWVNIAFLAIAPLIAVVGTGLYAWNFGITWLEVGVFFAMYWATGLSITAGYHRFFSHRTYDCGKPLQLFYLVFGAAAVENSAVNWCSDHRYHHRYVDQDEDPYNIMRGGLYAHIGWIFRKDIRDQHKRFQNIPDLLKNPLVAWQHKYYLPLVVLVGFALPAAVGALEGRALGGLLWGGFVRCVIVQHMTFFINSLAHLWGTRPYSEDNTARDNAWLGPFTFGEGYHNFHHKFQADYRNGHRWYQFDCAKWFLTVMAWFGQAWRLKRTPEALILKARLEVETLQIARRFQAAGAPERMWEKVQSRVEHGRRRLEHAYAQYLNAKLQYRRQRDQWSADMRKQWKDKVALYQDELNEARRRWRELVKSMNRIPHPSAQTALSLAAVVDVLKYRLF